MKKALLIILIIILIGLVTLGLGTYSWYSSNIKPVSELEVLEKDYIRVEIEEGMGITQIAKLLEESNVIRNADAMKIYTKLNNVFSSYIFTTNCNCNICNVIR